MSRFYLLLLLLVSVNCFSAYVPIVFKHNYSVGCLSPHEQMGFKQNSRFKVKSVMQKMFPENPLTVGEYGYSNFGRITVVETDTYKTTALHFAVFGTFPIRNIGFRRGHFTYVGCYRTQPKSGPEKDIDFCKENPEHEFCKLTTCDEDPDQEQCLPDTCEEDPELEECLIDWSRVLSNQRDMLAKQEIIKNNQSSFLDISSLAKDNLTANQQGLIDSSNDIIQNQSQVHSELINSSNSIIQKQLEIKNGQNDIVSDLQQFNAKTAQKQDFISNQIDSVKQSGSDKLGATKAITETLNTNHTDWIDLINEPSPTTPQQHFDNGVDLLSSVGDDGAAQELSSLDGVINDLTTGPAGGDSSPIKDGAVLPWSVQLNKYIPKASSCDLSLPNPITGGSIAFNTDWSDKLKSILAWIISFYTFLSLFEILFTPVSPKN